MKTGPTTELIDRAVEWVERCREGDEDPEALFDWLTESPRHVEVFLQALTLQQRIAQVPAGQWREILAKAGVAETENVVPLTVGDSLQWPRRHRARWQLAVAAGVAAIALAGAWLLLKPASTQDFITAVGEQRTVQLQDGSVVNLNTSSRLRVRITNEARELELLEGEALFKVQRDGARPFRVRTPNTVIQAVGTQFNVYSRSGGTTVSVLEGRVRVPVEEGAAPAMLSAGEGIEIASDGKVSHRLQVNAAQAIAWQQRRLVFDEETLSNIALEFNRYNHRQVLVQDAAAGSRRFSGIFDADDPDSLAQLLSREVSLAVERQGEAIRIRSR